MPGVVEGLGSSLKLALVLAIKRESPAHKNSLFFVLAVAPNVCVVFPDEAALVHGAKGARVPKVGDIPVSGSGV